MIGSYIKDHPNRFKIATKGGILGGAGAAKRGFDNSPNHLREALEKSLKNLGVEHVELYYIHRRDQERPIEEVVETLVKFKQEGKIGGIGFSEISPASLRRANEVHHVMAVQSEYSLWSRMPELGMVQACKELGAALVAFSPVGRGMFATKAPDPATFGDTDFRKNNPRFQEPNFSANLKALEGFKAFALEKNTTPAALAIAWVLKQGDHIIPIPGTRTVAHLQEDASGEALELTSQDFAEIARLLPPGFAHGNRYSATQQNGPEHYC